MYTKEKVLKLFWILIALVSLPVQASDEASFIQAWEKLQETSKEVEVFTKTDEKKYHVKFTTLPYEGELHVLAVGVETFNSGSKENTTGYVEIDLPAASDELMQKYSRTYYKWAQNNSLYFDEESKKWLTPEQYTNSLKVEPEESEISPLFLIIFEYWNYLLILIILYFFISQVVNNRRIKESFEIQKQTSIEAIKLHNETNKLLKEILNGQDRTS